MITSTHSNVDNGVKTVFMVTTGSVRGAQDEKTDHDGSLEERTASAATILISVPSSDWLNTSTELASLGWVNEYHVIDRFRAQNVSIYCLQY
jgi:hypothetical protein